MNVDNIPCLKKVREGIRIEGKCDEQPLKHYLHGTIVYTDEDLSEEGTGHIDFFPDPPAEYMQYEHHGKQVWVRRDLRGKHRGYCACYDCGKFLPNETDNCPRAQSLYAFCIRWDCVTPMWECPDFEGET